MYRSGRGRLIHYEDGWLDTARRRHISHQEKQNYWLNHHMSNIYFEIKHWKSIERPHRCCVWRGGKLGNLHKLLSTGTSSWPWTGPKESMTEGPPGNHTPAVGLWGPGYKRSHDPHGHLNWQGRPAWGSNRGRAWTYMESNGFCNAWYNSS